MTLLAYQKKALSQFRRIKLQQEKLMALTEDFYPELKKSSKEAAAQLLKVALRYQKEQDLISREIAELEKAVKGGSK